MTPKAIAIPFETTIAVEGRSAPSSGDGERGIAARKVDADIGANIEYTTKLHDAQGALRESGKNIAERKQVAGRVERINMLYRALGETNDAIIGIRDRTELLRAVAAITARVGQFKAVKIWMREPDSTMIHAVVSKGPTGDDLDDAIMTVDLSANESDRPTGVALSQGRPDICNEIDRERVVLWCRTIVPAGVRSGAGFPLREDGEVVGALSAYSAQSGYFAVACQGAPSRHLPVLFAGIGTRQSTRQTAKKCHQATSCSPDAARKRSSGHLGCRQREQDDCLHARHQQPHHRKPSRQNHEQDGSAVAA
jgi:GAF domain